MTKTLDEIRDELAREHKDKWGSVPRPKADFKTGFDAGASEIRKREVEPLREENARLKLDLEDRSKTIEALVREK